MKVLITNGGSPLSQELASALGDGHEVTLTAREQVQTSAKFVQSDLGHDQTTNALVKGVDAIVHSGDTDPKASVSNRLDVAMRCTYNLLWAAVEERVPRVIFLSSLGLLDGYDEDLAVTERWRPVPPTDPALLSFHLGEYVCREFARERRISVTCLRLGTLIWDSNSGGAISSQALYPDDATQAVERAMSAEVPSGTWTTAARTWNVFHIQSSVPDARYLTSAAQDGLGYSPSQRA
jgi:nucleoside-diphosphate-sugar epimerase